MPCGSGLDEGDAVSEQLPLIEDVGAVPERETGTPGIYHRSADGYPACGAEQQVGDVVTGRGWDQVSCPACLATRAAK